MCKLADKIVLLKRDLADLSEFLDKTYSEISKAKKQTNEKASDLAEKLSEKIQSRMRYLSKTRQYESRARLEELAKLLDYVDGL